MFVNSHTHPSLNRYGVYRPYVMYDENTHLISPVFTIWLTLFFLFVCNSASDYAAKRACSNARRERLSGLSGNPSDADALEREKSIGMQIPRSITALFHSNSFNMESKPCAKDVKVIKPKFLPMFPWYSGTSADLLQTLFNLTVGI